MANPPNPTNPNITTGATTGRVAADRYDFQKHIVGEDFRHDGYSLDLTPPVVINSVAYPNVHAAISQLANLINPPPPPDATASVKGLVRLAGDLAGTSTSALTPRVSGLQGYPVNTLTPTSGQILTWNGSAWGPAAAPVSFTAGGDLTGSSTDQEVISLSGAANTVTMLCGIFTWDPAISNPTISQLAEPSTNARNLTVVAQSATASATNGGALRLRGGTSGAGGLGGGIEFQVAGQRLLHASEVASGRRVLALAGSSNVTTTNMPANTGDRVIFIHDSATAPTTGIPVGGVILYSKAGVLWNKNADGYDFAIGSSPNPRINGDEKTSFIFEYRAEVVTTTGTTDEMFTKIFSDPNFFDSTVRVEAKILGRQNPTANAMIVNLTNSYVVDSAGTLTAMGVISSIDPRNTAGAAGWTVPTITISGNKLDIVSGANASTTIHWAAFINIYVNHY